jgi:hypothetical protein
LREATLRRRGRGRGRRQALSEGERRQRERGEGGRRTEEGLGRGDVVRDASGGDHEAVRAVLEFPFPGDVDEEGVGEGGVEDLSRQ